MKTSLRPSSETVSWCLETSIKTPFPGRISVPNSFVSLFIFYILFYLLLKTMGCFSECLMSSASDQKLFCVVCSGFKCSFHEFVGEKVVSLSISTILATPSVLSFLKVDFLPGALGRPRGIGWRGRWEGGSGWGTHVNPWLFHFNV